MVISHNRGENFYMNGKNSAGSEHEGQHEGHRKRMLKRFAGGGYVFDNFSEHEVLEVILFYVYKRVNTNVIAHKLINRLGSIDELITASKNELCDVEMVSENVANFIQFLGRVSERILSGGSNLPFEIDSPYSVAEFLQEYIGDKKDEKLILLLEESDHTVKLVCSNIKSDGSWNITPKMLEGNINRAASVLFTHSLYCRPISYQLFVSDSLKNELEKMGIEYIDHYVFDGVDISSLTDKGLM